MMIYLVTVNGKVSNEAYKTLEEAQKFIESRVSPYSIFESGYYNVKDGNNLYKIEDVRVK